MAAAQNKNHDEGIHSSLLDIEEARLLSAAVNAPREFEKAALRRAARALFQCSGGRPRIDDRKRLSEVEKLITLGMPAWPACHRVASRYPSANLHSLTTRLYEKISTAAKKHSGKGFPE